MKMKLMLCSLVATTLLFSHPTDALGHARLLRSDPVADTAVGPAPAAVTLWFGELLEFQGNLIAVYAEDGTQVDLADTALVPTDHTSLTVNLQPGIATGAYKVIWQNMSAEDGHPASGEFVFQIDGTSEVVEPMPPEAP